MSGPTRLPSVGTRGPELDAALQRAVARRASLAADPSVTSAYRLVHESADGFPGLAVDVYDRFLVAHVRPDRLQVDEAAMLDALHRLGFEGIYLKRRPRGSHTLGHAPREDLTPSQPVRGKAAPDELRVREEGVTYPVRLGEGWGTGLFLDQRGARKRVREWSADARVLNLFAYTCAFTVSAAAGGARHTVSVDISKNALDRGRSAVARVGGSGDHRFLRRNVFEALPRLARQPQRFDLILVDPPTYATARLRGKRKVTRWTSGRDWIDLVTATAPLAADGARLLLSTNDRRIAAEQYVDYVESGIQAADRTPRGLHALPAAVDFPPLADGTPHLHSLVVEL